MTGRGGNIYGRGHSQDGCTSHQKYRGRNQPNQDSDYVDLSGTQPYRYRSQEGYSVHFMPFKAGPR